MDIQAEVDRRWEELLAVGAFVPGETDENGEIEYMMVPEVLKHHDPELWQSLMDELDAELLSLHSQGLIDIDFTQPDPVISLTDVGERVAQALKEIS